MEKIKSITIAVLAVLLIMAAWDGCQKAKDRNNLLAQVSQYQLKEKEFQVKRNMDSSTIAYQTQTILTEQEANRLGLLNLENRLKEYQAQVTQHTNTIITDKQVPFIPAGWVDTSGWVHNAAGQVIRQDSIAVPQKVGLKEKWFSLQATINKTGVHVDTLELPNKTVVSLGYKKSGFLGLGRTPVVQVHNDNPYVNTTGLDNVVIKKKKHFWQTTFFHILVGAGAGFYLAR